MEVFRQSVMLCKGSRVCICPQPFCPPLLWHLREGHAPSIKGASLLFETRRAWGLYFTGLKALWKSSLGEAAVRKKKKMPRTKFLSSKLKTNKVMRSTAGESTGRKDLSASFALLLNVSSFIINCYLLQMLKLVKRLICCTETAFLIQAS